MSGTENLVQAIPCPWCDKTPDAKSDTSFRFLNGGAEGAVVCCCIGPSVPTGRRPLEHWREMAILAWNTRPPTTSENYDQKTKQILEKFEQLFSEHVGEIHAAYKKYMSGSQADEDAEHILSLSPDQLIQPGYLDALEKEMKGWKKLPD
jgi:hypothetical protein